jgi:hypothetical protein
MNDSSVSAHFDSNTLNSELQALSEKLHEQIYSFDEIICTLHDGLAKIVPQYSISCFVIDPYEEKIVTSYAACSLWNISISEKDWLIKQAKLDYIKSNKVFRIYHLADRENHPFTDLIQHELDKQLFQYSCNDGVLLVLYGEAGQIYSICFFHNWDNRSPLDIRSFTQQDLEQFLFFFQAVEMSIDNLFIHEKIEGLLTDKKLLTEKIEKDEADLKRRILELTVLYDTSNALGYSPKLCRNYQS